MYYSSLDSIKQACIGGSPQNTLYASNPGSNTLSKFFFIMNDTKIILFTWHSETNQKLPFHHLFFYSFAPKLQSWTGTKEAPSCFIRVLETAPELRERHNYALRKQVGGNRPQRLHPETGKTNQWAPGIRKDRTSSIPGPRRNPSANPGLRAKPIDSLLEGVTWRASREARRFG